MFTEIDTQKSKLMYDYVSIKHADLYVRLFGNFPQQLTKHDAAVTSNEQKLQSEKYVIDLFCSKFFGFTIFGLFKNKNS